MADGRPEKVVKLVSPSDKQAILLLDASMKQIKAKDMWRLLNEFPENGRKVGIIDSLMKKICKTALALKGIDYEYHAINLVKDGGEQLKSDYGMLNSMHQVPSLVIDGVTFTQSTCCGMDGISQLPIIEYLDEKYPNKPLLPKDPVKKFQARRIAEIVNSGIQPLQNLATLAKVVQVTGDDTKKAEWAQEFITKGFQGLERVLEETAGKFAVGDEVTIADLVLVPQFLNAARFNVDMTPFPLITRISQDCLRLDAFKAAHPSKQPDCPVELK